MYSFLVVDDKCRVVGIVSCNGYESMSVLYQPKQNQENGDDQKKGDDEGEEKGIKKYDRKEEQRRVRFIR